MTGLRLEEDAQGATVTHGPVSYASSAAGGTAAEYYAASPPPGSGTPSYELRAASGGVLGRLRSHSLDSGAPLVPPPLFPALCGPGGLSSGGGGTGSEGDGFGYGDEFDSEEYCNVSPVGGGASGLGSLGIGGGEQMQSVTKQHKMQHYHSRKYE